MGASMDQFYSYWRLIILPVCNMSVISFMFGVVLTPAQLMYLDYGYSEHIFVTAYALLPN